MRNFAQGVTIMGRVTSVNPDQKRFQILARSGDYFPTIVNLETSYQGLKNLDELNQDRFVPLSDSLPRVPAGQLDPSAQLSKYIHLGDLVVVEGVYQEDGGNNQVDARTIHLLMRDNSTRMLSFEATHWWLSQIDRLGNQWIEELFGRKMAVDATDFSVSYQTNLNALGLPTDDGVQEMATLSRLIYGLSSAYLLTGQSRYRLAAKAGVEFQRETFRSLSHDGRCCFWAYGREQGRYGSRLIVPSQNPDDKDTLPLYEQIYALAGLAQYYRITSDWEVLQDIRRTVRTFNDYYLDRTTATNSFPGLGGYFSHIDYATLRPDTEALGNNRLRKNWNSNGDHIPAYLVNLILALDPLPKDCDDELRTFRDDCVTILENCSRTILEKFPDRTVASKERLTEPGAIPYVNERFYANWEPDHLWGWQQNRAIVGHNYKIAWNLTRVAKYFLSRAELSRSDGNARSGEADDRMAHRLIKYSQQLAEAMSERGYDQIRGGIFDAVEREPKNNMAIEFTWMDTKDFWQQEQAVLAYLILYGVTDPQTPVDPSRLRGDVPPRKLKADFLALAREVEAFWNLYFLNHDNRSVYQRVTSIGLPVTKGPYGNVGAHSISGYHAFELNYLAHIYNRVFVKTAAPSNDNVFSLYFHPGSTSRQLSINVLPDFFAPGEVEIVRVSIRGVDRPELAARARNHKAETPFQITLRPEELDSEVVVVFRGHPGTCYMQQVDQNLKYHTPRS